MVPIKIVPKEDMEVLKKYWGYPGVVLIPETVFAGLPAPVQEQLSERPEVDYDFGGESDIMVDVVLDKDHYFVQGQLDSLK